MKISKRYISVMMVLSMISNPMISQTKRVVQKVSDWTITINKQQKMSQWDIPTANYSGLAYVGGDKYAMVSDSESHDGFFIMDIALDSITGMVKDMHRSDMLVNFNNKGGRDMEAIAYLPTENTVLIAGEGDQRIQEYRLDGSRTHFQLKVPESMGLDKIYQNYGFEALTYSPSNHLVWAMTEHTLKADGKISNYINKVGCLLRLQMFDTEEYEPVSQCLYLTDAPKAKKAGRYYAFGVSGLAALPDGTLLVLEREFYVAKLYFGSFVINKIYRVDPRESKDKPLTKELVTTIKTKLNFLKRDLANYEGICIGPRLNDNSLSIILVSDAQAGTGNFYYHLKDFIKVIKVEMKDERVELED